MKSKFLPMAILSACLCTGAVFTTFTLAEDKPMEKPKVEGKVEGKVEVKKPVKFGGVFDQVELSEAQRAELTKIRAEGKPEIAKLEEALKKAKDELKAKELAILTPEQQAKIKANEEEKAKAAEAKAAEIATKGADLLFGEKAKAAEAKAAEAKKKAAEAKAAEGAEKPKDQ